MPRLADVLFVHPVGLTESNSRVSALATDWAVARLGRGCRERAITKQLVFARTRMVGVMSDDSIAAHIESLVAEEQELRRREQTDSQDVERLEADKARLRSLEIELDGCWDLLRQRRSREEFGQDPDEARVRDPRTVEGYLQ